MIREHLVSRPSINPFICFPYSPKSLPEPFTDVMVDTMYLYFYCDHRPLLSLVLVLSFHSIINFSVLRQGTVHMSYCHIITSFLSSVELNVSKDNVRCLSEQFDQIALRQMALADMVKGEHVMI